MGLVTVACKIPNGIIMTLPGKPPVMVRGPTVPFGVPPVDMGTGFALTPNLDEEFVEEWFRVNAGLDMVAKKFVFANTKPGDARAMTKELREIKTLLEPLDPDKPGAGLEKVGVGGD